MNLLSKVVGFQWDEGNRIKNWKKHKVARREAEEIFFNKPQVHFRDIKHSKSEPRFGILGRTNTDRRLAAFYTIRHNYIRIISARDQQHGKERKRFEKELAKGGGEI
jgi:uncharacterized DUF497 family protein